MDELRKKMKENERKEKKRKEIIVINLRGIIWKRGRKQNEK